VTGVGLAAGVGIAGQGRAVGLGVVAVEPGGADPRAAVGDGVDDGDEPAVVVVADRLGRRRRRGAADLAVDRAGLGERQPGGAGLGVGQAGRLFDVVV